MFDLDYSEFIFSKTLWNNMWITVRDIDSNCHEKFYFYLSKEKDADSLIFLSIRRTFWSSLECNWTIPLSECQ